MAIDGPTEARRFRRPYIGTEHLLIGMFCSASTAKDILEARGVTLDRVRSATEFMVGLGDKKSPDEIGLTLRVKKVIQLAIEEAKRVKVEEVTNQHLLLGMCRDKQSFAVGILESFGVNPVIMKQIIELGATRNSL